MSDINSFYPSSTYPTVDEVKKYFENDDYKRVPICMELLSDSLTPVEVVRIAKTAYDQVFLFESADNTHRWGRYSFIGFDPAMEITCLNGELTISKMENNHRTDVKTLQVTHPGDEIREIIKEYKSPVINGLPPLSGGLVGYFSYDYIKYAEPSLKFSNKKGEGFRDVDLMLFDSIIVFDNDEQKIKLITGVNKSEGGSIEDLYKEAIVKLEKMAELLASEKRHEFKKLTVEGELTPEYNKERFCDMVSKAKHYIKEGDIFQVVLSNPLTAKAEGSLFDTYRILRTTNPSPYMFYFSSDDVEIAGASPETLAKLENGEVYTFPLAGTRKRGATPAEDKAIEEELLADEKECAEHNMLVDLGRNDIGKISKPGTVEVEKYMSIERFSHVMHIGSTVSGQIRDDYDAVNAIDSILPAGTLSGAPKIRACEIIEELEERKRGIYGGAVGYIDFAGNLDTCIGIRLVYKKDGMICVRSGAGIVYDSVPENEYMEGVNKAKAVVEAIEKGSN